MCHQFVLGLDESAYFEMCVEDNFDWNYFITTLPRFNLTFSK